MGVYNPSQKKDLYCGRPLLIYHSLRGLADTPSLREFCDFTPPWKRCTRIVIGTGNNIVDLDNQYPEVIFTGSQTDIECASWYASSDLVVSDCTEVTEYAHSCGATILPGLSLSNYAIHMQFQKM